MYLKDTWNKYEIGGFVMGRVRKGVYLDEKLIEDCDNMLGAADARSRNEFIEKALKFYLGYLKTNQA